MRVATILAKESVEIVPCPQAGRERDVRPPRGEPDVPPVALAQVLLHVGSPPGRWRHQALGCDTRRRRWALIGTLSSRSVRGWIRGSGAAQGADSTGAEPCRRLARRRETTRADVTSCICENTPPLSVVRVTHLAGLDLYWSCLLHGVVTVASPRPALPCLAM